MSNPKACPLPTEPRAMRALNLGNGDHFIPTRRLHTDCTETAATGSESDVASAASGHTAASGPGEHTSQTSEQQRKQTEGNTYDSGHLSQSTTQTPTVSYRTGLMTLQQHRQKFGSSKTWISNEARIQAKWYALEPCLARMYAGDKTGNARCPYVPRTFREYTEHRKEFTELINRRQRRILEQKEEENRLLEKRPPARVRIGEELFRWPGKNWDIAFHGKIVTFGKPEREDCELPPQDTGYVMQRDDAPNRSAVLSQPTIWCVNHDGPWRVAAEWPGVIERRWEGDQRMQSEGGRYGRFMPLPRIPAEPAAMWHAVPLAEPYPFDQVLTIPSIEDVYFPTDEIEELDEERLLVKQLVDALSPLDSEF